MAAEVYVDQQICIGCGLCISMAPEVFRFNEAGVSCVRNQPGPGREKIQEAMDSCPVNCIHWR